MKHISFGFGDVLIKGTPTRGGGGWGGGGVFYVISQIEKSSATRVGTESMGLQTEVCWLDQGWSHEIRTQVFTVVIPLRQFGSRHLFRCSGNFLIMPNFFI